MASRFVWLGHALSYKGAAARISTTGLKAKAIKLKQPDYRGSCRETESIPSRTSSASPPPSIVETDDLCSSIKSGTGGVVVVQPTRTNRVRMNRAAFGQLDEEVIMQNIGDAAVPQEYADLLLRIEEKDKRFVASRNFVRTQPPQSNQNTAGKRRRAEDHSARKGACFRRSSKVRRCGWRHGEGDFDYDGGEQAYREALERFENDDDNLRHIGFVDDRGNKWAEMGSDQKRTDEAWPVAMRWSIFHSCHENEALCAYATLCPWCIFAEVS